jgi:DNA-binding response OmpR family regulator
MATTVLLIEDEPNIKEAVSFILERDGCTVHSLADGATALAAVARHTPDVVILDIMLPGQSGLEVLRRLRADPATAGLPVLMLTAKGRRATAPRPRRWASTGS